jgi:hypothetical protein
VVSLHADDTNRAPTFDIDLDDLYEPDGENTLEHIKLCHNMIVRVDRDSNRVSGNGGCLCVVDMSMFLHAAVLRVWHQLPAARGFAVHMVDS